MCVCVRARTYKFICIVNDVEDSKLECLSLEYFQAMLVLESLSLDGVGYLAYLQILDFPEKTCQAPTLLLILITH